jgi:hypothetical protein
MCKVAYFRNPCSKKDVLCAVDKLNLQGIDNACWGFFHSYNDEYITNFLTVKLDVVISDGTYLYVCYGSEEEALDVAALISCGSLVLPDAESPVFWFIMRVC